MNIDTKQVDHLHKVRIRASGSKEGRFLLRFLEMQIPMGLGAFICFLVVRLISSSPRYSTVYYPGTLLYAAVDVLFLTAPVGAWMLFRGHGWRHSLEAAMAMTVPVAAIIVLGWLVAYDYLIWLITAGYPAMCLGLLIYMLYRRDRFMDPADH